MEEMRGQVQAGGEGVRGGGGGGGDGHGYGGRYLQARSWFGRRESWEESWESLWGSRLGFANLPKALQVAGRWRWGESSQAGFQGSVRLRVLPTFVRSFV